MTPIQTDQKATFIGAICFISSSVVSLTILGGCSGYPGPRSLVNDDPAIKIPEMRKAVDNHDRSAIPQLVKDLNSSDSAVRFYAINALQRLTGETYGYDWTVDDRQLRFPAVERWRNATSQPTASQPTAAESR